MKEGEQRRRRRRTIAQTCAKAAVKDGAVQDDDDDGKFRPDVSAQQLKRNRNEKCVEGREMELSS